MDTIEISLPKNDTTLRFIQMHTKEKLKCIDLGMMLFSSGHQKIQCWNNEQWNDKILLLQKSIQREKERNQQLINIHKDEKELFVQEIKTSVKATMNEQLSSLQAKKDELETKLQEKTTAYNTIYKDLYQDFERKSKEQRDFYEIKLASVQDRVDAAYKLYEASLGKSQNSSILGQTGETFTFEELNLRFPKAEIEDCHKTKGKGDFILKEKNFTMMIETKNYTKNVPKPEIDKFYRDFDNNKDFQCAIMVSLHSGICAREDFHLEVRDQRPIMFLHNVSKNIDHISLAVRFFKLILETENIDLSNKEVVGKLNRIKPIVKRNWNTMRNRIKKFEKDLTAMIDAQAGMVLEIFQCF
tara:strand:- start:1082 stop:2149 length:1068 start_codon:yes stop_codon:yes gene_type:complete